MKLRDVMTNPVIRIFPDESGAVAARTLDHYNIGALPVCGSDGRVCGLVTDRDIVTRCLAAGRSPSTTTVRDVMTSRVIVARPDMDTTIAAGLMGRAQIRRLPVMENGKLSTCGRCIDVPGLCEECGYFFVAEYTLLFKGNIKIIFEMQNENNRNENLFANYFNNQMNS